MNVFWSDIPKKLHKSEIVIGADQVIITDQEFAETLQTLAANGHPIYLTITSSVDVSAASSEPSAYIEEPGDPGRIIDLIDC